MYTQGKDSALCGPTALANAIELLGKRVTRKAAIEACGETIDGTDEHCIARGADALGFVAHSTGTHFRKAAWNWARTVRAGIICADNWEHWVTVHGLGDCVLVFDPESRAPEVLSRIRLERRWRLAPEFQGKRSHWTYFGIAIHKE